MGIHKVMQPPVYYRVSYLSNCSILCLFSLSNAAVICIKISFILIALAITWLCYSISFSQMPSSAAEAVAARGADSPIQLS